jgi:hypothetical protein
MLSDKTFSYLHNVHEAAHLQINGKGIYFSITCGIFYIYLIITYIFNRFNGSISWSDNLNYVK